ncbi:MAG: enoyl-CoA hydratase/isomerase family protein [Caulobacteraceae bacterium]|nr:enoyl-CoA hydratase/isomerase family protein [Caulobacteraceae bacterium]
MTPVIYRSAAKTARITLNRPDRLNAINAELARAFADALSKAAKDPGVEVVLIEAAGRAFCAGDDLVELTAGALDDGVMTRFVEDLQSATRTIMLGDKPVVCAAQGWIVGGGAAWLLNADFTIVSDDAVMFCPEAKHGLFPTGGVSLLLAERCGHAVANDVLWLGEKLDAPRMVERQIASRVTPRDGLADAAEDLVRRLLDLPAASRTRLKRSRGGQLAQRLEAAMAFEAARCLEAGADPGLQARIASGGWR